MQLTSLYLHAWKNVAYYNIFKDKISVLAWLSKQPHNRNPGDGDSWTMILVDTYWWIFVDTFAQEKSPFWVNFRGRFLGEF